MCAKAAAQIYELVVFFCDATIQCNATIQFPINPPIKLTPSHPSQNTKMVFATVTPLCLLMVETQKKETILAHVSQWKSFFGTKSVLFFLASRLKKSIALIFEVLFHSVVQSGQSDSGKSFRFVFLESSFENGSIFCRPPPSPLIIEYHEIHRSISRRQR